MDDPLYNPSSSIWLLDFLHLITTGGEKRVEFKVNDCKPGGNPATFPATFYPRILTVDLSPNNAMEREIKSVRLSNSANIKDMVVQIIKRNGSIINPSYLPKSKLDGENPIAEFAPGITGKSLKINVLSEDHSIPLSFDIDIRVCLEGNLTIASRKSWSVKKTNLITISSPVNLVFIHHTDGSNCTTETECRQRVRNIQHGHMEERKFTDIGYSFLVGGDGRVYEGRGWGKEGAHTAGYNNISIAMAFIGDFSSYLPNEAAFTALRNLIAYGVSIDKISTSYKLSGHRDAANAATKCPGQSLYNVITKWHRYITNP
ncbi:hypothetical protein SNE40_023489 [Patella caerulea]